MPPIEAQISALLSPLTSLRHEIHRHPELGFEEHETQRRVMAYLRGHGFEPRPCATTGVIADLNPGRSGRCLALRADMDCLPMQEHTDLPYRSVHDGRAHKCGHDGHTVALLGAASILAGMRERVDGNVRLIFQPAEEGVNGGGARVMVEEDALEGVDEIYAFHNWPGFPYGSARVSAGAVMASVHDLVIELRGVGGHASQPQVTRDPVVAGAALVTALQSVVSRNISATDAAVLSVCTFHAGEANNVIPARARLTGTLRTFDTSVAANVVDRIRAVCSGIAESYGVEILPEIQALYPVLVNHADCAEAVRQAAEAILGPTAVSPAGLPLAAAEDFGRFTERVPGAYFFLGAGENSDTPGCHHPDFDFDDRLIPTAIRLFVRLVEDRVGLRP
jgi:amidohydrolase